MKDIFNYERHALRFSTVTKLGPPPAKEVYDHFYLAAEPTEKNGRKMLCRALDRSVVRNFQVGSFYGFHAVQAVNGNIVCLDYYMQVLGKSLGSIDVAVQKCVYDNTTDRDEAWLSLRGSLACVMPFNIANDLGMDIVMWEIDPTEEIAAHFKGVQYNVED